MVCTNMKHNLRWIHIAWNAERVDDSRAHGSGWRRTVLQQQGLIILQHPTRENPTLFTTDWNGWILLLSNRRGCYQQGTAGRYRLRWFFHCVYPLVIQHGYGNGTWPCLIGKYSINYKYYKSLEVYTFHSYIKLPDDEGVSCMDRAFTCIYSFTLFSGLLMIHTPSSLSLASWMV